MPASPPVIPGYTVGAELGRSGMAAVWSATDDATGDPVALKVFDATGDDAATLLAEAARAAAVDHAGVVRVRDQGTAEGVAWIAMDLVPGRDLDRYVRENGPLPPADAALLVADAADGLAAVHAAGLVHRDVKPANLLLDEEDGVAVAVRISDFGIARPRREPAAGLTDASERAHSADGDEQGTGGTGGGGTAAYADYMAPEQWRGAAATRRGDVYGLGGVFYTALTGERPFPADTLAGLAYAVVNATPPRASDVVPDLPDDYDRVLAAALAKDPADRFPTATALADALRAIAAGEEPELPATPAPTTDPAPVLPRRPTRTAVAAVAAAVVVVALALALVVWRPWSGGGAGTGSTPSHGAGGALRRVVCAKDLELRDQPRGAQVGLLRFGDTVTVRRRDSSQVWAYVTTSDGYGGWVLGSWLRPNCTATPTP